jgi:DNA-binding response OmpR family regulator
VLLFGDSGAEQETVHTLLSEAGAEVEHGFISKLGHLGDWEEKYHVVVLCSNGADLVPNLIRKWRGAGLAIPIIVVAFASDAALLLDSGADDCVAQTISPIELRARMGALTRNRQDAGRSVSIFDLKINTKTKTVERGGKAISLSPREFSLLEFLVENRGKVVPRRAILDKIFNVQTRHNSNVVDVYIRYLRLKIDQGFTRKLIVTRRGYGYMVPGEDEVSQSEQH